MDALSYNPIHCMDCNLEVRPELLQLETKLVEWIAHWRELHAAIYWLWPESKEYEDWAGQELRSNHSPVNERGRKLQQALNNVRRCYYWFFQDASVDDWTPIQNCPACGKGLTARKSRVGQVMVCEACSIAVQGS